MGESHLNKVKSYLIAVLNNLNGVRRHFQYGPGLFNCGKIRFAKWKRTIYNMVKSEINAVNYHFQYGRGPFLK